MNIGDKVKVGDITVVACKEELIDNCRGCITHFDTSLCDELASWDDRCDFIYKEIKHEEDLTLNSIKELKIYKTTDGKLHEDR